MSLMYEATRRTSPTRFAVISLVMLAALGASVAVAWWLVRRHPASRAARVLEDVRTAGLDAYFPTPRREWLLQRAPDGKVIAWRARLTQPEENARFRGLIVHALPALDNAALMSWEKWRLNGSATEGEYSAGQFLFQAAGQWRKREDTRITLSAGQLKVEQTQVGQWVRSDGPVPDNYIPEGLTALATFLAARRGRPAQFTLILNKQLPGPNSIHPPFLNCTVEAAAEIPKQIPGAVAAATVAIRPRKKGESQTLHVFDSSGRILAILGGPNGDDRAATWDEVRGRFPAAGAQLRALAEAVKFPLADTLSPATRVARTVRARPR